MNIEPSTIEPDAADRGSWIDDRLPPPSAFFPGSAYSDILERVHRLVQDAEEVALLVGVQGAGKTTLLYRIQSDTPEHWLSCRVDANPMLHPDRLLNRLARCIDIPEPEEETTESVAAAFCKLRLQGRLPVIMVDDAEQLPISTLMTLLRLHEQRAADTPSCALILLAQPDIERTLTTHQLHAMGTARFVRLELPRLAGGETAEYVRHFLRMEGVEEELGFTPQQLAVLHSESGGLPGKINELVIRTLRDVTLSRPGPMPGRIFRWMRHIPPVTALATGLVVLMFLLTLLFQEQIDRLLQSPTVASEPDPSGDQQQAEPVEGREQKSVHPLQLPRVAEPLDSAAEPVPGSPEESPREPEVIPQVAQVTPQVPEVVPQTPDTEFEARSETAAAALPEKRSESEVRAAPLLPEAAPPVSTPAETVSKPVTVTPRFKREEWLLRQRPETYSLQILAAGNERSVREFAQKHQLTTDVYYFKSQRKGRPWIALLLGIYKDRQTAVTVLNMLPEPLHQAGAWPRSLRSIQDEIKQAR